MMNSQNEINQAINDFKQHQYGGWPWTEKAPHHGKNVGRFTKYADGKKEHP